MVAGVLAGEHAHEFALSCCSALRSTRTTGASLLTGAKARLPEIIARRNDFCRRIRAKRHEYDNLLTYFLYRHFMKALGDDAVQDKVQLALVSTAVIQLLDVYEWLAKGEVTHWGADLHLQGVLARD